MTMKTRCQVCDQWVDVMQITPHGCKKVEDKREEALKLADQLEKPMLVPGQIEVICVDAHKMYAAQLLRSLVKKIEVQERDYNFMKDLAIGTEDALKAAKQKADLLENRLRVITGKELTDE
jgi:hypothetical protein